MDLPIAPLRFSRRVPADLRPNALARLLEEKRRAGERIVDLTESNPTRAGIEYPTGFLDALAQPRALKYEPEPFGLPFAREAIAREFGARYDRVALAASTSELYSWLFKLLCDPGDEVLAPRPSYPLFEHLAALESVTMRQYGLFYDHGWFIDFHTLRAAMNERTRAVVVVNPNNPTGNFVRPHEWDELEQICAARGVAIIADEVFGDYAWDAANRDGHHANTASIFRLNGLSKTVGLPQMKLAWMIAEGPGTAEALERLEIVADTYLSAGTPVQCAVESLLDLREPVQRRIRERVAENLTVAKSALRVLETEAGWYVTDMLPPHLPEEETTERLLRERNVLVQPGYFYDFERSGYFVLSLLTRPDVFRRGVNAIATL